MTNYRTPEGKELLRKHYEKKSSPPQIVTKSGVDCFRSAKATIRIKATDEPSQVITGLISTITPDRNDDVMIPGGIILKHYFDNPIVLWMHDDTIPAVARNVGIQSTPNGVLAKTYFNMKTQLSKDLYALYSDGDMFAYSIGFLPEEYEIVENGTEQSDLGGGAKISYPKTECHYKKWELLEYSLVNIPMNAEAITLSLNPKEDTERMVRRAIEKGLIDSHSETLRYLGLDTNLKSIVTTVEKTLEERVAELESHFTNPISTNMEKTLSKDSVKELALHVSKACKGLEIHKDALSAHNKGMGYHKDAIEAHEKAIAQHKDAIQEGKDALLNNDHTESARNAHKEAIATHEEALRLHKDALDLHKDAFHEHSKSFVHHKDALEHGQEAIKGIHAHMKGYDAWDINDDVNAATSPFKPENAVPTGPDAAMAWKGPGMKEIGETIAKSVSEAMKPVAEKIEAVEKKLNEIPKASEPPAPEPVQKTAEEIAKEEAEKVDKMLADLGVKI